MERITEERRRETELQEARQEPRVSGASGSLECTERGQEQEARDGAHHGGAAPGDRAAGGAPGAAGEWGLGLSGVYRAGAGARGARWSASRRSGAGRPSCRRRARSRG
ncbi:unnamed protein product [Euphydryas editha]|uniref:Uncharacterized protein n=1 Tax=Euphydryas editha TaxID=104508 RepID=A0AAU9UUA4_EUPED|nr:unnamed protein product [Euphydryas editha]CAH2101583.1 unnamed protein product [Euphydryas editha]CAH2101584.1 unnamed protein product [Euphydryas editha]